MEMQVYGYDVNGVGTACKKSGTSALSLFFFKDDKGSPETDAFFKFTEAQQAVGQEMDLSLLIDYATPMHSPIYGYIGSLTQPPCTGNVCWYLIKRAFPITQKQLDYFKVKDQQGKDLESNVRNANLGSAYKALGNLSVFGPNNEIVDPSA